MMVKSGQEKVMVIYGRSLCTLLHAASLSVQCTAMHCSAAWLKGGWEELSANLFDTKCTPGPLLMRIHLVRNSTSANFGKTPIIFT